MPPYGKKTEKALWMESKEKGKLEMQNESNKVD